MSSSFSDIEARVGKYDPNRPAVQLSDGRRLTEGEVRALQSDVRYWKPGHIDPDYRLWVEMVNEITYNPNGAVAKALR